MQDVIPSIHPNDFQVMLFPLPSIIVYNIVGKAVMSLFSSSDSATVDIAHLANGIYIAEILTASGKGNVKLLKE